MPLGSKIITLSNPSVLVGSNTRAVEIWPTFTVLHILHSVGWSGGANTMVNPAGVHFGPQDRPFASFADGATITVQQARWGSPR